MGVGAKLDKEVYDFFDDSNWLKNEFPIFWEGKDLNYFTF